MPLRGRNYSKLTMVWAVTAYRQLPCCFMSPIAQASFTLFLLKHHASSFRWCYIPNHLKKLFKLAHTYTSSKYNFRLRHSKLTGGQSLCEADLTWGQSPCELSSALIHHPSHFWHHTSISESAGLNNFLRCDKRPGKRSFHGKGETEIRNQACLSAVALA